MEFFAAGAEHRERAFVAANRIGKSEGVGGYEMALHLTGYYPDWWVGRRFEHPIKAWAAGDTGETTRDIIQLKLLGEFGNLGTGLIPNDKGQIIKTNARQGLADAIKDVWIRHKTGGISYLGLKSYDQKRESFQGTEQHVIWLDEEPPQPVYTECLIRTMTTNGLIICTFTPLLGLSDVVLSFLPDGKMPQNQAPAVP